MKVDRFNAQTKHVDTQSVTQNLHLGLVLEANRECFVCVVIPSSSLACVPCFQIAGFTGLCALCLCL